MKVIAYNTGQKLKELITIGNRKKHRITWISNTLDSCTISFASGKRVVLLTKEVPSSFILEKLVSLGIRYVICLYRKPPILNFQFTKTNAIEIFFVSRDFSFGSRDSNLLKMISVETLCILDICDACADDEDQGRK